MYKRKVILMFGDTHGGSEYGLLHPETILERETAEGEIEEYTPQLTEIQKLLFYEIFRPGIKEIVDFAGTDEIIAIQTGDPTQGNKYTEELVSSRMSDQILIAVKNFEEVLQYKNIKKLRMIRSTGSHVFGEGSADVLVANMLRRSHDVDIAVHYHGEYLIKDVDTLIDVSHHGPSKGIRSWLEGNQFRFYLRDLMLRRILGGLRVPDIVVRAHTHGKLEEWLSVADNRTWGFITPPMQFPNGYARQVTGSVESVEMGMLAVEIIQYSETRKVIYPHWITKKLNITSKEVL